MKPLRRKTLVDQTAEHLREGCRTGRWCGTLPGVVRLAKSLVVSKDTVRAALKLLESEHVLKTPTSGKRRQIVAQHPRYTPRRNLRVVVLLNTPLPHDNAHSQQLILSIQHSIESAGHACAIGEQSLSQMGHKMKRIEAFIEATTADAWIVYGGTRQVFEWFAGRTIPVLAIGGRTEGLPIACTRTDIGRAMSAAVDALVAHGHRRIVLICSDLWRLPTSNSACKAFLARLQHHGLKTSEFNIPNWTESPEGLENVMRVLYSATPPTALLVADPSYCVAVLIFLAGKGLQVPHDVSFVNIVPDPIFNLHRPVIDHFEWPIPPHVHRATLWVEAVARGNGDRETATIHAKFIPGGTIARAKI